MFKMNTPCNTCKLFVLEERNFMNSPIVPYEIKFYEDVVEVVTLDEKGHQEVYVSIRALLAANNAVKSKYHQDVTQIFQAQLISKSKAKLLTPTEIGEIIRISAREVNRRLANAGLQEKAASGKCWLATEKGKKFCEYLDIAKRHTTGTPVQQLKWYETVLPFIAKA